MKAIFINAKERTVTYVENKGQLEDLYNTMGVDMVEIGWYNDETGDHLYVDEEGLLNGTDFGFTIDGRDFVGNGLIYGTDPMNPANEGSVVSKIENYKIQFFTLQKSKHLEGAR